MRVMSGTAVLRALASDPVINDTPVIVLSALAEEEIEGMAEDRSYAAFVQKPISASALAELVGQVTADHLSA